MRYRHGLSLLYRQQVVLAARDLPLILLKKKLLLSRDPFAPRCLLGQLVHLLCEFLFFGLTLLQRCLE